MNINFGNIDSPYIIKVISKYDPNKDDYTTIQQTVTMQTTINEYTFEASYDNTIAFSTSSGQDKVTCLLKNFIKSEITYGKMYSKYK